jgi:hypothetical protein
MAEAFLGMWDNLGDYLAVYFERSRPGCEYRKLSEPVGLSVTVVGVLRSLENLHWQ